MNNLLATLLVAVGLGALVRAVFADEVKACFERDPAARNLVEVLLTYAGLHAVIAYRIAHALETARIPVLPRWIMSVARWATGIEIHPAATIGRGLFIDHGMGVVIGETAVIGDGVTIFQGVTLGGTGKDRGKRHPTIGNHVVIGTGAKVLGNITIGDHSIVGANAVVIRNVPEHSTVVGVPGRITKIKDQQVPGLMLDHTHLPDPIAQRLAKLQREIDDLEKHFKDLRRAVPGTPPPQQP